MLTTNAPLDLSKLDRAYCCIVELGIEPPKPWLDNKRPLQQVTLRPDKISAQGFIRVGETQGDEAFGWMRPEDIFIHEVLGIAEQVGGLWEVRPVPQLVEAA